ncbi:DUF294 nucleotidyltransferase-like domain-containing protein [Ammoniphilus sp. 3BR4]|uniref:DUF294 nucleotidyltransferase-like domain-containing protein n=1 Tax=Ammoniphilus sp. 3BR4 TaxID=3158265 RepID=UPI0034656A79
MGEQLDSYQALKQYRDLHMVNHASTMESLNAFHDWVMKKACGIAQVQLQKEKGPLPAPFSWFVMGSAGRSEQGRAADQDHGLVYEGEEFKEYFEALGVEITNGLFQIGYPLCEGKVMSSNRVWCQSSAGWERQLAKWLEEESWNSIRHLLIFYDARVLVGSVEPLRHLKNLMDRFIEKHPAFLFRLLENTKRIRKGVGLFQQFLTETHGPYMGSINLKEMGLFPYINAARLLAMKEKISETSTLSRLGLLGELPAYLQDFGRFQAHFRLLLDYKLKQVNHQIDYEQMHFLNVQGLTPAEKSALKQVLKDGVKLHQFTQRVIEKGC